ncbi:MAG: DUF5654 family protein [Patescibacteria group bacterium]|jgi:hypothetical protein
MKEAKDKLKKELFKTMVQLATAGFGLVAALAWNEAIQSAIKEIVPVGGSNIISKLVYALIVTIIAVSVTYSLGKMAGISEAESKDKK